MESVDETTELVDVESTDEVEELVLAVSTEVVVVELSDEAYVKAADEIYVVDVILTAVLLVEVIVVEILEVSLAVTVVFNAVVVELSLLW